MCVRVCDCPFQCVYVFVRMFFRIPRAPKIYISCRHRLVFIYFKNNHWLHDVDTGIRYSPDINSGFGLQMAPRSPSRYRRQSTPSGHRLSNGLHSVPSTLSLRPREMTDSTFQLHLQLQHFYYSPIHPRSHSPNRLDPGWSETSFADSGNAFGRKYSSYESSD